MARSAQPQRRMTRSQSRDIEGGSEVGSAVVTPSRARRKAAALEVVVEESPARSHKHYRPDFIPDSPEDATNISGTTFINPPEVDTSALDPELMLDELPDLESKAKDIVNLLVPAGSVNFVGAVNAAKTIHTSRNPQSRLFNNRKKKLVQEVAQFGQDGNDYIDVRRVRDLLYATLEEKGALGQGWSPDPVLYKANCAQLAIDILTQSRAQPVGQIIRHLEALFPSMFLSDLVGRGARKAVGESTLERDTLSFAIEIRTQSLITTLEDQSLHEREFDPYESLGETFYTVPVDESVFDDNEPLRGFGLEKFSDADGFLPEAFCGPVNERVNDIGMYLSGDRDEVVSGLKGQFPWQRFALRAAQWIRKRVDEIDADLSGQDSVDVVREGFFTPTRDRRSMGTDRRSVGTDRRSVGTDRRSIGVDRRSMGTDRRSVDRRSVGADRHHRERQESEIVQAREEAIREQVREQLLREERERQHRERLERERQEIEKEERERERQERQREEREREGRERQERERQETERQERERQQRETEERERQRQSEQGTATASSKSLAPKAHPTYLRTGFMERLIQRQRENRARLSETGPRRQSDVIQSAPQTAPEGIEPRRQTMAAIPQAAASPEDREIPASPLADESTFNVDDDFYAQAEQSLSPVVTRIRATPSSRRGTPSAQASATPHPASHIPSSMELWQAAKAHPAVSQRPIAAQQGPRIATFIDRQDNAYRVSPIQDAESVQRRRPTEEASRKRRRSVTESSTDDSDSDDFTSDERTVGVERRRAQKPVQHPAKRQRLNNHPREEPAQQLNEELAQITAPEEQQEEEQHQESPVPSSQPRPGDPPTHREALSVADKIASISRSGQKAKPDGSSD
ncbi:hypothetical protein P168DRAFT_277507 [Aspergillus campestris IBT 28561]|uniref:Uncharacterized protein n=1 Tax=Aspergillus campestris (strain IBT 28561) TaxID=1392248 RepID=A0A2I1DD98_ASPC2|nr:uncharacterized protein P168DRAFT_277507 [Aspergillus campestris IBT 28561]PKY07853.1 hypothetical protein P168DRAFT_277507 [Aspergillus campestris IBT 28561]